MAAPIEDSALAPVPVAAPPAAVPVVVPPAGVPLAAPAPVVPAPAPAPAAAAVPDIPAALTTLPDTAAFAPPLPVQSIVDALPGGPRLPDQIPVPHDLVCEGTAWSAKAPTAADHHQPAQRRQFWADADRP
jgi:hypothetical protein